MNQLIIRTPAVVSDGLWLVCGTDAENPAVGLELSAGVSLTLNQCSKF